MFTPTVIYEDNHLLVVEKPINIPVQEDASEDPDLLTLLKQWIKEKDQKPGNVFLGLVHRLDRPVGGVMVFAKTSKAASRLTKQMYARTFEKEYLTVVRGVPMFSSGRLVHWLLKDEDTNIVHSVSEGTPDAKRSILEYECLETQDDLSLIKIQLETGRSHQIRVQMVEMGCVIYGDQKYGVSVNEPGQQLALWSTNIRFFHPTKDEPMMFTSTPPKEYPWNCFHEYHSVLQA